MRTHTGTIVAVLVAVLTLPTSSSAQYREGPRPGMFGERELGKPLKPGRSRFGSGLEYGPSGNFLGRSTANRGTTFQPRTPPEPETPSLIPPEAYHLEPEMVPGYLEDQARRMAAARAQQERQLAELYGRQQPQPQQVPMQPYTQPQPAQPTFPPAMPQRPDRYLPPAMPVQPGFPQPQPGVPGPTQQDLQNSPDRWFRGAPSPTDAGQQASAAGAPQTPPALGLGPVGTLGPTGLNRPNPIPLGSRIARSLGARAIVPVSATVQGDLVTLQGTVATAADRQLAERMAAMEPGVRRIDNRIQVQPAPGASDQTAP